MKNLGAIAATTLLALLLSGCGGGGGSSSSVPVAAVPAVQALLNQSQSVLVGSTVTLNGSGLTVDTGPTGEFGAAPSVSYQWALAVPAGSTATLSDASSPIATFVADKPGTYAAALTASAGSLSSKASATVTAGLGNVAPVANAGVAQSVLVGKTSTLDGAASSDANGDLITYNWTLTSKPAGSAAMLSSANTVRPGLTPDLAGSYLATLTVSDGKLSSGPASVTVTAAVANLPPVANAGVAQNVVAGSSVTLDGSASSDANGDLITYNWTMTSQPAGSTAALSSSSTARPGFVANAPGTYVIALLVNDGRVNSAPATVTVTAAVANVAPVANAGVAQNVVAGSTVTLDGSASTDANGDLITYGWTLTSRPAGSAAVLTSATTARPIFTADAVGAYVATLTVNDGKLNSAPTTVTVTAAAANVPPVANAGLAQSVAIGSLVTLDGSASSDANGDVLTYRWTMTSQPTGGAAVLSAPNSIRPSFTADAVGTYVVALIANDSKSDSATVTVTVTSGLVMVTTLAGSGVQGKADGVGSAANFASPAGVAVDNTGIVYVADFYNHIIRKISLEGKVTTLAGSGDAGSADGAAAAASFNFPAGVAVDKSGNVYVADANNNKIRKISPAGNVTTLAGSGDTGSADAVGIAASFAHPYGVAVDSTGNVYIADRDNNKIRKISPAGVVTTLAGTGLPGIVDGSAATATFDNPMGVVCDDLGNLYVADTNNAEIRKISSQGMVSTFAGSAALKPTLGMAGPLVSPRGLALDKSGNIYVADEAANFIRRISTDGKITVFAGMGGNGAGRGSTDGVGTEATFYYPSGVAVDEHGNIYVADQGNNKIRKITQ